MLEILFEIGPVQMSFAGCEPISETELRSWQANQKIQLQPWECRVIRQLSKEYAAMLNTGGEHDAAPYLEVEDIEVMRRRVMQGFKGLAVSRRPKKGRSETKTPTAATKPTRRGLVTRNRKKE